MVSNSIKVTNYTNISQRLALLLGDLNICEQFAQVLAFHRHI